MSRKRDRDEHLESLWHLKEHNNDSFAEFKATMGTEFDINIINELASECLVSFDEKENKISLNKEGEDQARQLIRAHRIAERMLYDVLGIKDFEFGACEFEHTITPELIDGICILLGHPKFCPHGLRIPDGECCKKSLKTAQSSVVPLTEIKLGIAARVAYVTNKDDQQLHKIDGLHIRPGSIITVHQTYPAFVVECEGVNIALADEVASSIFVWKDPKSEADSYINREERPNKEKRKNKGFMHRVRKGMMW